jgi:pyruvate-ferredoxin/flavodoxin oxidoreductase
VQLNPRMFAYDENRKARIADASAGTCGQPAEAAESVRVAAIHPGKPKSPNEPGHEELHKRAEAFL